MTAILDAITHSAGSYPASFAVSAGSNRKAFFIALASDGSNAAPATAVTLGGQSMTLVATVDDNANTLDVCIAVFELNEAGIAAMSGNAVSVTGGSTAVSAVYFSVSGADQSALTASNYASSTSPGTTSVSLSLARGASSVTCGVSTQDISAVSGWSGLSAPAEVAEFSMTNSDIVYGLETDTARTASFVATHSTSRQNASIVFNIPDAASGAVISTPTESSVGAERATIGFTTDTASGTAYIVFSTDSADLNAITGAQLEAGQYDDSSTADYSASGAVSTTSPTVTKTGIFTDGVYQPGVTVHYAVVHKTGSSYSNILTDSFVLLASDISAADYVQIGTPNAVAADRITAVDDLSAGNIIAWGEVVGGSATVHDDGTITGDESVTQLDVQRWDGATWSAVATQYVDLGSSAQASISGTITGTIKQTIRSTIG